MTPRKAKPVRGWACIGTHGKIYYTAVSQDLSKQGRVAVYLNYVDARNNAIGDDFVVPVEIREVAPKSKRKKK